MIKLSIGVLADLKDHFNGRDSTRCTDTSSLRLITIHPVKNQSLPIAGHPGWIGPAHFGI